MTPPFALSLSVEGITLLHRVPAGWHRAGGVSLDTSDLAAAMAQLLDTARSLEPGAPYTKLILPNDQIRYMTIETARTSIDDIHQQIAAATPVPLDEMVIDFDRSGGRTHIAAVAKQTLLEAETFARDYGFEPVSFVAVAQSYTFTSEVFFGPTRYARETLNIGSDLRRDDVPPVATGTTPVTDDVAQTDVHADKSSPKTDQTTADDLIDIPVFASRNVGRAPNDAGPTTVSTATAPAPARETNLKGMIAALETAELDAPAIPNPLTAAEDVIPPPIVPPTPPRQTGRVKSRLLQPTEDSSGLLSQMATKARPSAVPVPKTQAELALAKGMSTAQKGRPRYLGLIMTAALIFIMLLVAMWASTRLENGIAGLFRTDPGLQDTPANALPAAPDPVVTPAPETAERQAAEAPTDTPPTPIVTEIPGRVLSPADAARIYAATGVWQRAPRLPDLSENSNLEGIYAFATLPPVPDIPQPGTPDLGNSSPDLRIISPSNPAPANRPLPRDENGFVLASVNGTILPTGVWIYGRAPSSRPPLRPTDEPVGLDDSSIPAVQETILAELSTVALTNDASLPQGRVYGKSVLSQPLALVAPSANDGLDLASALTSPPPQAPAAPGPSVSATAPTALPPAGDSVQSTAPAVAQLDRLLDQQVPARSEAGAADTPLPPRDDGFVAPDTFVEVITGRPSVVPPLRPGTPEVAPLADPDAPAAADADVADIAETPDLPETAETAPAIAQDPALEGIRPAARPENLVVTAAQTFEAIPALAGPRPVLRPASLETPAPDTPAEADTAEPVAADIASIVASIAAAAPPSQIINPTRSAIVASPRPDTRPQNFARVVSSAQALATSQQSRDVAAATSAAAVPATPAAAPPSAAPAAAAPSAPVTGGQTAVTVARAATMGDAISLRDMNLIGVYGKPGARRALIRLSNGRFVKVEVGSSLDGGQVTAIGDSALNFVKRGQTYALQLPAG